MTTGFIAPPALTPPKAAARPETIEYHGIRLTDSFAWLRDPDYPIVEREDILEYLRQENAYFDSVIEPQKPLIEHLFEELKGRIKDDDESVPVKDGLYLTWRRFLPGAQYRVWLRRLCDDPNAEEQPKEQVVLDETALAEGLDYFRTRAVETSWDGSYVAWSSDTDGSERYTIRVRRIEDCNDLSDEIPNTSGTIVWTADGTAFLYTELSEQLRPFRVKLHQLGEDVVQDRVIFEEKDPSFFVGLGETHSRAFILINIGDHETSEVWTIPASDPYTAPRCIAPRESGIEYELEHVPAGSDDKAQTGWFFIRTNDQRKDFRLMRAAVSAPDRAGWQSVDLGPDPGYLRHMTAFRDALILGERVAGIDRLRVLSLNEGGDTESLKEISFPEPVYSAGLGENPEFSTEIVQLTYTSMVTPTTVFDFNLRAGSLTERKVQEVPSGYDRALYQTERLTVVARDGAEIPVSLVYRKDFKKDGTRPLHLYGYGAYGMGMVPSFSTSRLSLLDRGFAFAIAHIRGGDELGYGWYEAGKREHRQNTFNDFIDCAKALIAQGYAREGGISISGGSAGGTLMGAVLNDAPHLWCSAVAHVPFVDVLNTMLDSSLPLTPIEWPEWGDPITDADAFQTILSYSPYENVSAQAYPPLFITAGLSDPRVTYWEPAKWATRLRATKLDQNVLLLKTNMDAGHGGKSGRYEGLKEVAEEYAFILVSFGLADR